ncbi:MAG TPA: hypothetical protein VFG07_03670 [Thermoplasmata archaeon]|nr:hypothetical protein [Thermoplasmata archaeon]
MSSALVLGDRGSGLTTFVGLLYTAQVRLGIEEADEFRFSADRESIRRIGTIYGSLVDGRFPEADADWELHPLSFIFGYRRGGLSSLAHRTVSEDGEFDTVRVQVGGIPAEEVAELNSHDAVLDRQTRGLLRSPVVIPLVDASWLAVDPKAIDGLPMARYDQVLANTLVLLGKFLAAEPDKRARRMYPLFVVTKFDRVPRGSLRKLESPSTPPVAWSTDEREMLGQRLLDRYLPKTSQALAKKGNGSILHDSPAWFFSGLKTEDREGETRIARRERPPLGGWEPDFPYEEYRALLLHLGQLAHRLPDEIEA